MNLRHLRYAIVVAEEQHFTRAAQRLRITQSALSTQIRDLERELGVTIFARTSRHFSLTPVGEVFLDRAYAVMGTVSDLVNDVSSVPGGTDGRLRIGVSDSAHLYHLGHAVAHFLDRKPDVAISVLSQSHERIVAEIDSGSLDGGIINLFAYSIPRGLRAVPLWADRLGIFASRSSPWSESRSVAMADLAGRTLVDFPSGSEERQQTDQLFRSAGSKRGFTIEANSIEVITSLVAQDAGIAMLPLSMSARFSDLVTAPIAGAPERSVYALVNPRRTSSVTDHFIAQLASSPHQLHTGSQEI